MLFYRLGLGVLLALSAGLGMAAPPDVPAALKVKPGQLVRVSVKADPDKLGTAKTFTDSEAFWGELVGPKGTRQFVFQAPAIEYDAAGKPIPPARTQYVVSWWTAGDLEGVSTTITVDYIPAPAPVPVPPAPTPTPPVPPTPAPVVAGKRFIVIVEETGDAVPARGVMLANAALAARIKDKGHLWRCVDKDNKTASGNAPADLAPYIDRAKATKVPRLFIVAETGDVVFEGDPPADPAKFLDVLTKAGG